MKLLRKFISVLLLCSLCFANYVYAYNIKIKIITVNKQNENTSSEILPKAIFTPGNDIPVVEPEPQISMSLTSVPNDGFVYTPIDYVSTSNIFISTFKELGRIEVKNTSGQAFPLQYKQATSSTVTWNVSSIFEANAKIGNRLLSEIAMKLGITVSRSAIYYSSNEILWSINVPPGVNTRVIRYVGGVQTMGGIKYEKRTRNGSLVGYWTDSTPVGGIVLNPNALSWSVSNFK